MGFVLIWRNKSRNVRNFFCAKYIVFTMGGTVALRPVNKNVSGELEYCSKAAKYLVNVCQGRRHFDQSSEMILKGFK